MGDTTAPMFNTSAPNETTVSCDNVPEQVELDAYDNCGPAPVEKFKEEFPDESERDCETYTLVYYWVATDNCQYSTTEQQTINVKDTTSPNITGVPDSTSYSCEEMKPVPDVCVEDVCSEVNLTYTQK